MVELSQRFDSSTLALMGAAVGGAPEGWSVEEIGDGNLNFVFRVRGPAGQVLVKQAVPYLRCVGESWPLSVRRSFFERKALEVQAALAPAYVPRVFGHSDGAATLVMEYLGDHVVLRRGLMQGRRFPQFAEQISEYLARCLFLTSDLHLPSAQKKQLVSQFCDNVELCKITEDLIFTDPYRDAHQNRYTPELEPLARSFFSDVELKMAVTRMKAKFLTSAEALLHGDLHTGSIMVSERETKVIDPEFACFGPMGFDLGLLLANFFLAYFSQAGLGTAPANYEDWLLEQAESVWVQFARKFGELWTTELHGDYLPARLMSESTRSAVVTRVRAEYMAALFDDAIRFAACEMTRRILGLAHVAELDTIADARLRACCEARALHTARTLLLGPPHQGMPGVIETLLSVRRRDYS
jgi:5-methylthioribose kinase